MEIEKLKANLSNEGEAILDFLVSELNKLRTGRANPHLLDKIIVENYGIHQKLREVANIQTRSGQEIIIKPYDANNVKNIVKAIVNANLGINPTEDGKIIRLVFPSMTNEVRKNIAREARKIGESQKVKIRNLRTKHKNQINQIPEAKSKDNKKFFENELQNIHNEQIKKIDEIVHQKEQEILKV